jgi:hypothetical protein
MVALSAHVLFAPPAVRAEILRHEAIHSAHQRMAPRDDSAAARARAERIADDPSAFSSGMALPPVPSLLGFPPQPLKPFDQVWIGHVGIIGVIVSNGITVRISLDYRSLGIDPVKVPQPAKAFFCGKHDMKPIPDTAKKMKDVADIVAKLNSNLPDAAKKSAVQLVVIAKDSSAYRVANGTPTIVLNDAELNSGELTDTLRHETSHAIYEFHSVAKDPKKRTPDVYALAIADLFNRARNTVSVTRPATKFDPTSPPSLKIESGGTPAGLVMVTDTLWAGSGGHPWDGPDEFFASAFGEFLSDPGLQKQIFAHYAKADKKVGSIAAELLRLLAIVDDTEALGKLKAPAKEAAAAAAKAIEAAGAPPDITKSFSGELGYLADPSKLPGPENIKC